MQCRFTETCRLVFTAQAREDVERGGNSQKELECRESADLSFIRVIYAEALVRLLKEAQLDEALTFFSSSTGRCYLRYATQQQLWARGLATGPAVEPLNPRETEVAGEFMASDTGYNIFRELRTAEFRDQLFKRLARVIGACNEGKTATDRFSRLVPPPSAGEVRAAQEQFTLVAYD